MGLVRTNEKCIGCNRCVRACSCTGANIAVEHDRGNVIEVDPVKCIACGACIDACEHDARELYLSTENPAKRPLKNRPLVAILTPAVVFILPVFLTA